MYQTQSFVDDANLEKYDSELVHSKDPQGTATLIEGSADPPTEENTDEAPSTTELRTPARQAGKKFAIMSRTNNRGSENPADLPKNNLRQMQRREGKSKKQRARQTPQPPNQELG